MNARILAILLIAGIGLMIWIGAIIDRRRKEKGD